ncbi:MAG: hypothetical protein ABSG31_01555 [Tepidisphaeraceae bacterium]
MPAAWILAVLFTLAFGSWATWAGLQFRWHLWANTRTIRSFVMANGYRLGSNALRESESQAKLPDYTDMLVNQPDAKLRAASAAATLPRPATVGGGLNANVADVPANILAWAKDPALRRLTIREILGGIVHFYDRQVDQNPGGDYDMDYSPMRLLVMTLWTRHTQRNEPSRLILDPLPPRRRAITDTEVPQPEDAALPVIGFNAACTGAAALGMFALVWLWMARDPNSRLKTPNNSAIPNGLIAFMCAAAGFWFTFASIGNIPSRPSPIIRITQVHTAGDAVQVGVSINPEGNPLRWRIDWGQSPAHGKSTKPRSVAGGSTGDLTMQSVLRPISPGHTIYLRALAYGNGDAPTADSAATEDVTYTVGQPPLNPDQPEVGGLDWPDWTVWIRMGALLLIMVIAARRLPGGLKAWACGLVAGMFVWFNPPTMINTHVWPQWDAWILPFIVAMVLLGSLEWWTAAGIAMAIGMMLKAQLLIGAPILILWPLLGGKLDAAVRVAAGFALGVGLLTWPWLIRTRPAIWWMIAILASSAAAVALTLFRGRRSYFPSSGTPGEGQGGGLRIATDRNSSEPPPQPSPGVPEEGERFRRRRALIAIGTILLSILLAGFFIIHPTLGKPGVPRAAIWSLLAVILVGPWILPKKYLSTWILCIFAASIGMASLMFDGSYSWAKVGLVYGSMSDNHDNMVLSRGILNLPCLLDTVGFNLHDPAGNFIINIRFFHWHWDLTSTPEVKTFLASIYGGCLFLCGIVAAVHSRRRDPRVLAALFAPWVIFPIVLCQMQDRYLMWGAAMSAAMVAVSTGMTLMHVLLSILAAIMAGPDLLTPDQGRWPQLLNFINGIRPAGSWLMILIALIFLAAALMPSRPPGELKSISRS